MCVYTSIIIYVYMERERERERYKYGLLLVVGEDPSGWLGTATRELFKTAAGFWSF